MLRAPEPDAILEARLEVLAWLGAKERLDIRVVLPVEADDLHTPRPDSLVLPPQ